MDHWGTLKKKNAMGTKSKGKYLTGYIELPAGQDVSAIDVTTVTLTRGIASVPAEPSPAGVGDFDSDGIADLSPRRCSRLGDRG